MDMSLLISTVAQGLLWALMALGVYITGSIINVGVSKKSRFQHLFF